MIYITIKCDQVYLVYASYQGPVLIVRDKLGLIKANVNPHEMEHDRLTVIVRWSKAGSVSGGTSLGQ